MQTSPLAAVTSPATSPLLYRARIALFAAVCFVLPMKAAFIYSFSALLLIVWLAEGRWPDKLKAIAASDLCRAMLFYYLVYVLAMLWTENVAAGWKMVDRHTPFLLFLLYWSCAEPQHRERYVHALVAGTVICALLAHYNLLQTQFFPAWPPGPNPLKDPMDTAPFVDRILYTPILALAAYFSLRMALFATGLRKRVAALAINALLLSNLAFSGGRAGIVMFAALLVMLVVERTGARFKALLICALLLPLLFVSAYKSIDYFAERFDAAMVDIRSFEQNPNTSLGLRFIYWKTSWQIFTQHPLLGVGSGDFIDEYQRNRPAQWHDTRGTRSPHNQYLLTAVTTGLLGLSALLLVFYRAARSSADARMRAVLAGFAVVCLFESYLWRSNTALAFMAVVAMLADRPSRLAGRNVV